jgi:Flp pilus assembly protein TadD
MAPEAVAAFRDTIRIAPEYAPGHRALGELLLYQGQVDESLTELHQAAALDPNDAGTHAALAKALSAKHLDAEADEEMRKAQQDRPQ